MLVPGRVTWICLLSSLLHSIPQRNVGSSVATDNKPFQKSNMSIPIVTCSYWSSMFFLLWKYICFSTFMVNLSLADSFINDRLWHLLPYWISVCCSLVFPPCLICGALDVCLSTVKFEDKMGGIPPLVEGFEKYQKHLTRGKRQGFNKTFWEKNRVSVILLWNFNSKQAKLTNWLPFLPLQWLVSRVLLKSICASLSSFISIISSFGKVFP